MVLLDLLIYFAITFLSKSLLASKSFKNSHQRMQMIDILVKYILWHESSNDLYVQSALTSFHFILKQLKTFCFVIFMQGLIHFCGINDKEFWKISTMITNPYWFGYKSCLVMLKKFYNRTSLFMYVSIILDVLYFISLEIVSL